MNIAITQSRLLIDVIVYELIDGKVDRNRKKKLRVPHESKKDYQRKRNILYDSYPELRNRRLQQRYIPRNENGTWIIPSSTTNAAPHGEYERSKIIIEAGELWQRLFRGHYYAIDYLKNQSFGSLLCN